MRRSERGAALLFTTLTLAATVIGSAFAIDLGQAYTARRQMQNAADAGAFAGARALMKTRVSAALWSDLTDSVWTSARDTAQANGAGTMTTSQCKVIRK